MSFKTLAFFTAMTVVLVAGTATLTRDSSFAEMQQQRQRTALTLELNELRQPHFLSISAPSAVQLKGRVELDGQRLASLNGKGIHLDISPYLSRGQHAIAITGSYVPDSASVQIELKGPNTLIQQQASGSGSINQMLMIEVR